MRRPVLLSFAAALALLPASAQAGSYLRLEAGRVSKGTVDGYAASGTYGGSLARNINLEAEFSFTDINYGNFFGAELHQQEVTAIANILYDIPIAQDIEFNVGAGIGLSSLSTDRLGPFFGDPTTTDTEFGVVFQAILGVDFKIASNTDLTLRYRYRQTELDNYGSSNDLYTIGVSFAL